MSLKETEELLPGLEVSEAHEAFRVTFSASILASFWSRQWAARSTLTRERLPAFPGGPPDAVPSPRAGSGRCASRAAQVENASWSQLKMLCRIRRKASLSCAVLPPSPFTQLHVTLK